MNTNANNRFSLPGKGDETVDFILLYDPTLEEEIQKTKLEAQIPLIYTGEYQIGWMRAAVWEGMHEILLEQGILDEPVDLDEAFTMQFLKEIYGETEQEMTK